MFPDEIEWLADVTRSVLVALLAWMPWLASAAGVLPAIDFSAQEQAYIAQAGTIRMCVDPDWMPFERISEEGRHEGIAADLIQLVAQRVGLRIELHPVRNWQESLEASQAGVCQIMSFLNRTPQRDRWLIFTSPIFFDPNVVIAREEHGYVVDLQELSGETVALPRGTMVEELIRREYPNLGVVLTGSEQEAVRLVSERKADLTIRSLMVAAHAIRKEGLFNLKIAGHVPEFTNHLRIGVIRSEPVLRDILDKGVNTLTQQEREAISNRHVAIQVQQGFDYRLVWKILAGSARFLAIVVALNLVALVFLLVPPLFPFVFYGINGYLLGREYYELVALRRLSPQAAHALRRAHAGRVSAAGVAIAFLLTVPFVNLVAPIIGTAAMVHLFEDQRRDT